MRLNRKRQLWISENPQGEQPNWLLLSAGITERKMSRKSENLLFFEVGKEQYPQEISANSVKLITLQGHLKDDDPVMRKILSLHGRKVGVIERDLSKNADNYGIYSEAELVVTDDGSGKADEPQSFEICLKCGQESPVKITSSVNVLTFTML